MVPAPDSNAPEARPAAPPAASPSAEGAESLGEHHGFEADPRRQQELRAQRWAGVILVVIGTAFAVFTLGAPVRTGWLAAAPIVVGVGFLVRTLRRR